MVRVVLFASLSGVLVASQYPADKTEPLWCLWNMEDEGEPEECCNAWHTDCYASACPAASGSYTGSCWNCVVNKYNCELDCHCMDDARQGDEHRVTADLNECTQFANCNGVLTCSTGPDFHCPSHAGAPKVLSVAPKNISGALAASDYPADKTEPLWCLWNMEDEGEPEECCNAWHTDCYASVCPAVSGSYTGSCWNCVVNKYNCELDCHCMDDARQGDEHRVTADLNECSQFANCNGVLTCSTDPDFHCPSSLAAAPEVLPVAQNMCPSSPYELHAQTYMELSASATCNVVVEEIKARIEANYHGSWTDPHNAGHYYFDQVIGHSQLDMHRETGTASVAQGGPFRDNLRFQFHQNGDSCEIMACSASQVESVTDFSTGYCNIRNLVCGSDVGCVTEKYDFQFKEGVVELSPGHGEYPGASADASACIVPVTTEV